MPAPLAKKLAIKPGHKVALLNAPMGTARAIEPLPADAQWISHGAADVLLAYARDLVELRRVAKSAVAVATPTTTLWLAYPRKDSALGSDLSRDVLWKEAEKLSWMPVAQIALDDVWTALRFKPADPTVVAQRHARIAARTKGETTVVTVPADLARALRANPKAKKRFDALAPSHRKEHVRAIEDAKKPETRASRVAKAVAKLVGGS